LPISHFQNISQARAWVTELVAWYNTEHRHSSIRFVTPAQRHKQLDQALLDKRHALYQSARAQHPNRWSQNTRNWQPIRVVHLNPDNNTSPF
jgi:putative transposase